MRILTILMLFFFTTFLVVPTCVSIINHDADVSVFYDMEEDSSEKEISIEEVKMALEILSINFIPFYNIKKNKVSIYQDVLILNNFTSIFSPPPELI